MLKTLRTALTAAGGAQTLIAIAAVAWGLGRLQSIAEERQAQIAQLDAHLAERLENARNEAAGRHPSRVRMDPTNTYTDHEGRERYHEDGALVEDIPATILEDQQA